MASIDLLATSLDTNEGWTKVGALTDVNTINSDDTSTSYFKAINDGSDVSWNVFWAMDTMPASTAINSLLHSATVGRSGSDAGGFRFRHKTAVDIYNSEGNVTRSFLASWGTQTSGATTYQGGSAWTTANINTTKFGFVNWQNGGTAGREGYITYHKITVDYTPSTSTFLRFFSNCLIGALTLPSMVQAIVDDGHTKFGINKPKYTVEELAAVKDEIRKAQRGYIFL